MSIHWPAFSPLLVILLLSSLTTGDDAAAGASIADSATGGHDVRIGGALFSDAMGAEGTYEGTYVGMIDHNVTVIAGALGAEVPARGLHGRLSAGS